MKYAKRSTGFVKKDRSTNDSLIAPEKATSTESKSENLETLISQIVRYTFVGGASAAFELAVFQVLYALVGLDIAPSNIIALVASTAVNFTMNRSLAFKSSASPTRSLALYLALFAFNTTFSTLAITWLVNLGLHSAVAKLMTMVCIVMWNFVLYRKVIFK